MSETKPTARRNSQRVKQLREEKKIWKAHKASKAKENRLSPWNKNKMLERDTLKTEKALGN